MKPIFPLPACGIFHFPSNVIPALFVNSFFASSYFQRPAINDKGLRYSCLESTTYSLSHNYFDWKKIEEKSPHRLDFFTKSQKNQKGEYLHFVSYFLSQLRFRPVQHLNFVKVVCKEKWLEMVVKRTFAGDNNFETHYIFQ
jgi:hypothetical protein